MCRDPVAPRERSPLREVEGDTAHRRAMGPPQPRRRPESPGAVERTSSTRRDQRAEQSVAVSADRRDRGATLSTPLGRRPRRDLVPPISTASTRVTRCTLGPSGIRAGSKARAGCLAVLRGVGHSHGQSGCKVACGGVRTVRRDHPERHARRTPVTTQQAAQRSETSPDLFNKICDSIERAIGANAK